MAQGSALASLVDYSSSEDEEEVKPPPRKRRKKPQPKAKKPEKKFVLPSATDIMLGSDASAEFIEEHRKNERRKFQVERAKNQVLDVQTVKAILADRKKIAEKTDTVNTILEERRLRDEAVAVAAIKTRMEEKKKAEESALSQEEKDARSAFSMKNAKKNPPGDSAGIADDLSAEYEEDGDAPADTAASSSADTAAEKKKRTRKEMEKAKRMRGQSSIDGWKSETYMKVRQEFD